MASLQEIKSRISSIQDTKKVTGAMYMIASIKMRRAMREVEVTKPYFRALKEELGNIFRAMPESKNIYYRHHASKSGASHRCGVLVITADRGLCGSYNHDVVHMTEDFVVSHPNSTVFVVGEYGRQYLTHAHIPIDESFCYSAEKPTVWTAQCICTDLLQAYRHRDFDEIHIIYTDYKSGMTSECKTNCLLPLDRSRFSDQDKTVSETEFFPGADEVLDHIVPSYLTGFIYGALTDSFCSEQHARMSAMDAAGRNADEMMRTLKTKYNTVRQAAITREITEITAGAKSLRQHREQKGSL